VPNYNKDIFRQLTEQTERADRLESENRELRVENTRLRKRVNNLEETINALTTDLDMRIEAAVAKAITPLSEEIVKKEGHIQKANDEITRLKAVIDKNSNNSSKPPSSNGLKKVMNSREPSGNKRGGQRGHKGYTLTIPKNLDELVREGKAKHIIKDEANGANKYVSDWEIDIQTITVYTERRRPIREPQRIRYGAEVRAHAVYLSNVGMMSLERIAEYFAAATHGLIAPSEASIFRFIAEAAENIDIQPMVFDLLNGLVLHTDETPVRTVERPNEETGRLETAKHTTFNAYVRTYSNATTTLLTANAHKNDKGVKRDNILTRFFGIVAQDHEAKLYKYGTRHATCGEHLGRELRGMDELCMLRWAGRMRSFMLEMNEQKKEDIAKKRTVCDPFRLHSYELWYDKLIEQGAALLATMRTNTIGYDELRKMTNRLRDYKDSYLLFIRDYTAPFTNNQAERDLRHCKTKQKVSGCYRSWQGLLHYCKIRSLVDTTRKRRLDVMLALRACFVLLPAEL
jgi:regulator of replication initiation timing